MGEKSQFMILLSMLERGEITEREYWSAFGALQTARESEIAATSGPAVIIADPGKAVFLDAESKIYLVGLFISLLGLFMPAVSVSSLVSINLIARPQGQVAICFIGLAVVCLFLNWRPLMRMLTIATFLWLSGSLGWLLWRMHEAQEEVTKNLANNPFAGVVGLALQVMGPGFGWFPMIGGCFAALLFAAFFTEQDAERTGY